MPNNLVDTLMENQVALQKHTAELLEGVNRLTKRVERLLDVFEAAAKNIERGEVQEPLAQQLRGLLEQNKTIARGLLLLEKYVRERSGASTPMSFPPKELPQPEL